MIISMEQISYCGRVSLNGPILAPNQVNVFKSGIYYEMHYEGPADNEICISIGGLSVMRFMAVPCMHFTFPLVKTDMYPKESFYDFIIDAKKGWEKLTLKYISLSTVHDLRANFNYARELYELLQKAQ